MGSDSVANSIANAAQAPVRRVAPPSGISAFFLPALRVAVLHLGRLVARAALKLHITGLHHAEGHRDPLIVVANHFGWYDAMILTLFLPRQPVFLVATESQRKWYVRLFMRVYDGIPIWRGQVDREAFRRAADVVRSGRWLGIFPEGGMNPDLAERIARGEVVLQLTGNTSRPGGVLARGKPGAALLAVNTKARVLPVALIGTGEIGYNIRRLRRTPVEIHLGEVFGPLRVGPAQSGHRRREQLDQLADEIMQRIAAFFPPEKRGPYRDGAHGRRSDAEVVTAERLQG
jgi:1-acyl-sn-glycerol-3-phosphate acyltransferase